MDLSIIYFPLFVFFLAYRNAVLAKAKGKNALLFGILTVISLIFSFVFGLLVVLLFCKNEISFQLAADPKNQQLLIEQMTNAMLRSPVRQLTYVLIGFGGYLLVRYFLDRIPEKKKEMPFWPDKEQ